MRIRRLFRLAVRGPSVEQDVDDEIAFHFEMAVRDLVEKGMSPEDARREAGRRFGDVAAWSASMSAEDRSRRGREQRVERWTELWQDVRYAARGLRTHRGFATVAVVTLALGIGLSAAIFSVVDAMLLRSLPFPEAERIVIPLSRNASGATGSIAAADLFDWRAERDVFARVALWVPGGVNLSGDAEPERVTRVLVSDDFFETVGVKALLGRTFIADDHRADAPDVAVIGYGLWRRRFGGDPTIVGSTVRINGVPVTVVGVLPARMEFPRDAELWRPLDMADAGVRDQRRDNRVWLAVARLQPGVALERADARVAAIAKRVADAHPESQRGWSATIIPVEESIVGAEVRRTLYVLLGAVGFVLLIGCANVANLLLVRGAAREREIAVRTALGASRGRVVRQLLTESVVLALAGGVVGMLLATWGTRALVALAPPNAPRLDEVRVNGAVLGFALAISLLTALIFGLLPSLQATRTDVATALRDGARRSTGGVRSRRARSTLVVAEVALSLVLLIGAGLMTRSFARLRGVDPGVRTERVLTMTISLPWARYESGDSRATFFDELVRRLAAVPGVRSAALTSALPVGGGGFYLGRSFLVEGQPEPPAAPDHVAMWNVVSPGYFATMGVPIVAGRAFTPRDDSAATPVIIVSQSMARRVFGDANPLGRRIRSWRDENRLREIVGVARDVRYFGLDAPEEALVYVPLRQDAWQTMVLAVQTDGPAAAMTPAVRATVGGLDKDLAVGNVKTIEQVLGASLAASRLVVFLLGVFGALALLLAAVGLYGLISYAVTQRTHEIGIRIALGAESAQVRGLVVRQAMLLVAVGLATGILGALGLTRVLASLLYEVSATDPLTFATLSLVLVAVALLATWLPARRATRVDPIVALRSD